MEFNYQDAVQWVNQYGCHKMQLSSGARKIEEVFQDLTSSLQEFINNKDGKDPKLSMIDEKMLVRTPVGAVHIGDEIASNIRLHKVYTEQEYRTVLREMFISQFGGRDRIIRQRIYGSGKGWTEIIQNHLLRTAPLLLDQPIFTDQVYQAIDRFAKGDSGDVPDSVKEGNTADINAGYGWLIGVYPSILGQIYIWECIGADDDPVPWQNIPNPRILSPVNGIFVYLAHECRSY